MERRAGVAWRRILATILVAGTVFTCVRLGLWQLSRAAEKRLAAAARATLLAEPPVDLADPSAAAAVVPGRRVRVTGTWDRDRWILLSGRTHLGAAGVVVVSPVVLADGARVLVERGWLAAADARTAHPEAWPDSVADVIGVAQPLPAAARPVPWAKLEATRSGARLWSARTLDSAEVARHVPAPHAAWSVAVLRAGGVSAPHGLVAVGEPPGGSAERVHVSYAIQWFTFALIALVGSVALMVRGSRNTGTRG